MNVRESWSSIKKFFSASTLFAIIIFLLCIVFLLLIDKYWKDSFLSKSLFIPISSSIIAAIVVTLTIDIKKQVSSMQNLIIDAFTTNSFLEKLTDDRLKEIRSRAITQMHKQKYPNMQQGLMDMDKEIFSALMRPYYETYRETAIYQRNIRFAWRLGGTEVDVLHKCDTIQYTIKSPTSDNEKTTANISIGKSIQTPEELGEVDESDIKRIFNIRYFNVTIDDHKKIDIKDKLKYLPSTLGSSEDYYNTRILLSISPFEGFKDKIEGNNANGIFVEYKKEIRVEICYEIYTPIEDNHFTNRLKYPAKSFRLDCICNDDKVRFYGELLGTFTENSKIKISHASDNILSIESFEWLLPRNGVFVVLCEKEHKKAQK